MNMPIEWTIDDVADATKADVVCRGEAAPFGSVSIDSRNMLDNSVFVAIKGANHDGHTFIKDVLSQGIGCVVIDKSRVSDFPVTTWQENRMTCFAVSDTLRALGDLAAYQRKRADVSVIAITGSNGKTTTRAMAATMLEKRYETLSTQGNFNNEIGLPLTLLRLSRSHKWAVVELGMNSSGEIGRLTRISMPDIGMITNIGVAHLEGLGSIEGIMHAKGELIDHMDPNATAVLNADDPMVLRLAEKSSKPVVLFGTGRDATIRAASIQEKDGGSRFKLELPEETVSVDLKQPGRFMVSNALAAAAAGHLVGLSAIEIKDGIEAFKPVYGRMNLFVTNQGVHVIDDTYNANPVSMGAAIETLVSLKGKNRGIFIAGDMFELGSKAASWHRKIGAISARSNITKLYASGEFARDLAEGARSENMRSADILTGTKDEIFADLSRHLRPDDWVLVKGSRAMGMEEIVEKIKVWEN